MKREGATHGTQTKKQALSLGGARLGAGARGAAGGLATWVACDRPVPTNSKYPEYPVNIQI